MCGWVVQVSILSLAIQTVLVILYRTMCFLINVLYISTLILLQGHQSEAKGQVCLQCNQVAQPSDCRNVKRCGDQELCIMRKYVTNDGHVWFDVGCSSSQRCSPITSIIGKRNDDDESLSISSSKLGQNARHKYVRSAGDTIVCEKCCSGDICNAGSLCGTFGFLHEMVCFNWSSTNEDGCNTIALCDQNEKCFIEKAYHSSTSNIVWKTGCRHKDVCQHLQSNPGTDCSSSCCSSDLCNMKCINNSTVGKRKDEVYRLVDEYEKNENIPFENTKYHKSCYEYFKKATCADKSQTCTNTTFQSFVCSAKELQVVCPRSCGLCHCAPNPCTHGTCTSSLRGYKCTCDAGYTGSICERVIDHCTPNPCTHGTCTSKSHGYKCACNVGYMGSTCNRDIDHCTPNPCTHGTCTHRPHGYKCTCTVGYMGLTCDSVIHGSSFRYTDCNSNQALLHFDSVKLNPYPPSIPGNITVSGHLVLGRNISGHIELQVSIHVHAIFWIPVPCVSGFGSCTYDLCSMLSSRFNVNGQLSCPPQLEKQNLPCTCPIQAGTYTLNPDVWTIPPLPSILSYLSSGDYKVDVKLVNKYSGEIIGCYNIQITFAHKCTGFGCIFG